MSLYQELTPPFPLQLLNDFEMVPMAQNLILIDEEQEKENSSPPLHPTIPVSERPIQPPVLMRSHPFGTKINATENIHRFFFE